MQGLMAVVGVVYIFMVCLYTVDIIQERELRGAGSNGCCRCGLYIYGLSVHGGYNPGEGAMRCRV